MPDRQHGVTRLEGFSDAVFGFALTLLVVSLEVPKDSNELLRNMGGFVPFALMFAMVCWIWYEHNVFFRLFGMQDPWTVFLNSILLFVVLFYVYPLKFLTTSLLGGPFWRDGLRPIARGDLIMLLYSAGVVLVFGTFVLLYRHAWRKRGQLDLSPAELLKLKFGWRSHMISMLLGVASIVLVLINRELAPIAGFIYALMGPLHGWNGYQTGKALSLLPRPEGSADSGSATA